MADERTAPDLRPDHVRRGGAGREAEPPSRLGRYELLFELARGGMGTVHVARLRGAHGFDRVFAVKRPLVIGTPGGEHEPESPQRPAARGDLAAFLDEARLSAKIHHPNVVETLDLGEHDGAPFLVMTFVPGVSLARLLGRLRERGEPLDPWLVAWMVREVALGLHAAHELRGEGGEPLGLVHRDVSPENVLLSFDGRALVTDFGVARWRFAASRTETGVTKGKLAYMAPEQTRGGPIDRRTDVFALGVVAHESLLGRRLFAGDTPAETLRRVLEHEPEDPHADRPEVPADLAALVLRCLRKDPAERPTSADEIAAGVRALLRRERRVVDASDLAAVIARAFPGERERLAERIERAAGATLEPGAPKPSPSRPPAAEQTSASHASVTSAAPPVRAPPGRRSAWLVGGVAVVLAAGSILAWARRPSPPPDPPSGVEAPAALGIALSVSSPRSLAVAAAASQPLAPAPSAPVASTPSAGSTDPGPASAPNPSAPPSARPAQTLLNTPPAGTAPSASAPASASGPPVVAPSPSPKASSNKGAPFRSLDL